MLSLCCCLSSLAQTSPQLAIYAGASATSFPECLTEPRVNKGQPHPAPPTAFPVSAALYVFLPLLGPKIWPSLTTLFLSHPFSNPSGNPMGSTFKINQPSSHVSPPAFYHPVPSHRLASDFCNSLRSSLLPPPPPPTPYLFSEQQMCHCVTQESLVH